MNPEINETEFYVNTVKQILQTQNVALARQFRQNFQPAIAPKQMETVIYLALHSLAETDPESFTWALHHYDHDLYVKLRTNIAAYAIRQLIDFGFILGIDFSSLPNGNLILTSHIYHFLMKEGRATSAFIYLLLQETLQIGISSASDRPNALTDSPTTRAYPPRFWDWCH